MADGKPLVSWKKASSEQKTNWKAAAEEIKGWAIDAGIEDGVAAIQDIINSNTKEKPGSRRFLISKQ